MMKNLTFALLTLLAGVVCGASPADAEYLEPVRPGGVGANPFWNGCSRQFMYAPAFDFAAVPGASAYRFEATDDLHDVFCFTSAVPTAALSPVWDRIRPGYVTVVCTGVDVCGKTVGEAGRRTFWRSAPFREGAYPKAAKGYAECATRLYDFLWNGDFVRHLREKGVHDGAIWLTHYLCKMNGAIVSGLCTYAKMRPDRREEALKTAVAAADELLAYAAKPGTPLAHFPPTYLPQEAMTCDLRYDTNAWKQTMLLYPVTAADAYLDLYASVRDPKWLTAAEDIAGTFLKLQGEDGTWPLLVSVPDGKPTTKNRCMPITHILLFERLFALTGKDVYRVAGDRAFAYIERGPLTDWNWEGQFEDVGACARYRNQTHIGTTDVAVYLLKRFPEDARRLAQAREIIRFAEDQFVIWEPLYGGGRVPRDLRRHSSHMTFDTWITPAVCEQWECFSPVDASAANMIRAWIALHRATGEARPLAKARAIADTMTRVQHPNGDMPTWWRGGAKGPSDWVNCAFASADALAELVARNGAGEEPACARYGRTRFSRELFRRVK